VNAAKNLARNLYALRQRRGLTQQALAKLAGLPRSTVSYMESGEGNPSLKNLCLVSAALQVGLEDMLARRRPPCELIRSDCVPKHTRVAGITVHELLPDPIPGMEINRLDLQPGSRMGGKLHVKNTKEYVTCIHGQLRIQVSGEGYTLNPGDVLAFPGHEPHSYYNAGPRPSSSLSVVVLTPIGLV